MTSLDQWTPKEADDNEPLIVCDEHAFYLYEQSYGRQVEMHYDILIACKLAEEEEEMKKQIEQHAKYVESNYIRVGA